jgi:AcrR family transcriptional regulator
MSRAHIPAVPAGPDSAQDSAAPDSAAPDSAAAGSAAAGSAAAGSAAPASGAAVVRRGRPRSQDADRAILLAATEILAERGLGGMSIEEVAARAGVAKTTIYRRWPSRGALALDAFLAEFQGQQPLPDTGTLRGDLLAALRAWIRSVTRTSAGPVLAGLIAETQQDPDLAAAWRERVVTRLRDQHKIMLDRAIQRGEIAAGTDQEVVLDLLFGAAYHRLLHGHQPLTDAFARQVVDLVVAGLRQP